MTVLAVITGTRVVARVLDHIGLPSSPPPLDPPRLPSDLELDFDLAHGGNVDSDHAHVPERPSDWDARPPPYRRGGAACSFGSGSGSRQGDDLLGLDCYEGH